MFLASLSPLFIPSITPPLPEMLPKASVNGLVALIATRGSQLRELHFGVEDLKLEDAAQILAFTPQIETLAIPFISIGDAVISSAPSTLGILKLYLLLKSEVVIEEATRRAAGRLAAMDLEPVVGIVLTSICGGLEYEGLAAEVCKSAEEQRVTVWKMNRESCEC